MDILSPGYRWRRGNGQPFEAFGLEWCERCRQAVDTETQAAHRGTVYVWKRWCRRCGKVISYGKYDNCPIVSDSDLQACAIEWVAEPGEDRR